MLKMKTFISKLLVVLVILSLVITSVPINKGQAESKTNVISTNETHEVLEESDSPEEYYTEEEVEALGDEVVTVPYDDSSFTPSNNVTREHFESDEEYQQFLNETMVITPFSSWLTPPLNPITKLIKGILSVQRTLKNSKQFVTVKNGSLAGKMHAGTKVPFKSNGFPIFPFKHQFTLPNNLLKSSNATQFSWANKQLYKLIEKDFGMRNKFTQADVAALKKGNNPPGYTWHHHEKRGVLQLVNSEIHSKTGHTGGKAIWGSL